MAGYEGRKIYNSVRWRRLRLAILERDGWRCKRCGRAGMLEVHHRKAIAEGGDASDPANLETICRGCHIQHHRVIIGQREWLEFLDASFG